MDILVVDDKETNRKLLRSMLELQSFTVIEAADGESAVRLFIERQPALVLMDIMMPGMNGMEATRNIKAAAGDNYTPVIYVTALKPEEAIKQATEAGGDDFICKPIHFDILNAKISAHLRIRELNNRLNQANLALREHHQRVQQELEIVEHIFSNALKYSWLDKNTIQYYFSPLSIHSGDVLLAERRPDGGLCMMLGDFTGHGLPAAMGTLPMVKVFFTMVRKGIDVSEIASEMNATLKMLLPATMFCSAVLVDLDQAATRLRIWSGGLPPMLLHNTVHNTVDVYECQHMALGILPGNEFEKEIIEIPLSAGSKFYIYTDGIVETLNSTGERYGIERLKNMLIRHPEAGFKPLIQDLERFRSGTDQQDDLTLAELNCMPLPARSG